jgi:hypothetical protein
MDLKEIDCEEVDWIQLAEDRVQWEAVLNMVINFWVPKKGIQFTELLSNCQLFKKAPLCHGNLPKMFPHLYGPSDNHASLSFCVSS